MNFPGRHLTDPEKANGKFLNTNNEHPSPRGYNKLKGPLDKNKVQ